MGSSTICLFTILGFVVLIIIVANSATNSQTTYKSLEQKEAEERAQKASEEQARQNAERQQKIAKQKELEDRYAASPLTGQIICAISDGTGCKPEIIEVYDDRVTGRTNGTVRTFDFYVNRVKIFDRVYDSAAGHAVEEKTLLRPQVALASATNRRLGNEYELFDKAKRSQESFLYSDGGVGYLNSYTSDHVRLVLKSNDSF